MRQWYSTITVLGMMLFALLGGIENFYHNFVTMCLIYLTMDKLEEKFK